MRFAVRVFKSCLTAASNDFGCKQVDGADGKAAAQVLVDIATAPLAKAAAGGKKGKRKTPLTRPLVRAFFGEEIACSAFARRPLELVLTSRSVSLLPYFALWGC